MSFRLISFEDREPFFGLALRKILSNVSSELHRDAIKATLRSRSLRRAVLAEAWDRFQLEFGGDGKLIEFFEWLLENQDEIIALIMKLLPLFI